MSTVPESKQINGLPDDFFDYNADQFYQFIKQSYGDDLAELFSFQSIRNGLHIINTSPDDILSILQLQSETIDKLRNLCCLEIDENTGINPFCQIHFLPIRFYQFKSWQNVKKILPNGRSSLNGQ